MRWLPSLWLVACAGAGDVTVSMYAYDAAGACFETVDKTVSAADAPDDVCDDVLTPAIAPDGDCVVLFDGCLPGGYLAGADGDACDDAWDVFDGDGPFCET